MTIGGGSNKDGVSAAGVPKKKQRIGRNSRLSSTLGIIESSLSDGTLTEGSNHPLTIRRSSHGVVGFNDCSTADVILRLHVDPQMSLLDLSPDSTSSTTTGDQSEIQVYLHSRVLRRCKYFAALLSDRWQKQDQNESSSSDNRTYNFNLAVPSTTHSFCHHLTVLQLLYSDDLLSSIESVSCAINLLPIALELLFEDCIKACVKFLEAVPWSEDEERKILCLIPLLSGDEEAKELIARVTPAKADASEEMLHGLILSAIHNHPNMAFAKAFVAKLLRDFTSKVSVKKVLDKAFDNSLRVVKQAMEEYLSPDFRGDHNETEAIQRLNLHAAMSNLKHLLWLVERMIELKVADSAVKAWSEQASFTADLLRAFRDDAWRNIVPSLPVVVIRCTSRLASAVATGNSLAGRQVRMKLVRDWLPVLIICKDTISTMGPNHKSIYTELEETFLSIISTLPMSDAQDLLQQCLSFSTRNVDDCPHLVAAFTTWFRRANRPPPPDLFQ